MKKTELLAPAGNLDRLKIAFHYGADAVYIGGKSYSLRARASNFSLDDIKEAAKLAKSLNKKVYVTMNIIPHNEDFKDLDEYLLYLEEVGVKGIIVSSNFIASRALKLCPKLEVHLSTQLSIANSEVCNYYYNLGIKRVVLARELDLNQIHQIKNNTFIELEVFIHGGMCSSFSGRCMLSNYMVNRDANRGGCAHSCRWDYDLIFDEKKELMPFKLASKDLCAVNHLVDLLDIGIESLKIEGRMKSDYYIASVVRLYRELIDDYYNFRVKDFDYYIQELAKVENRPFSNGFFLNKPNSLGHIYEESSTPTKEYLGLVLAYDEHSKVVKVEQRNYFTPYTKIEFFGPNLKNTVFTVKEIWDEEGNLLDAARHPKQIIYFKLPFKVSCLDMMRMSL